MKTHFYIVEMFKDSNIPWKKLHQAYYQVRMLTSRPRMRRMYSVRLGVRWECLHLGRGCAACTQWQWILSCPLEHWLPWRSRSPSWTGYPAPSPFSSTLLTPLQHQHDPDEHQLIRCMFYIWLRLCDACSLTMNTAWSMHFTMQVNSNNRRMMSATLCNYRI